jgi:phosphoglycerate dehydrogenase-like enzyme
MNLTASGAAGDVPGVFVGPGAPEVIVEAVTQAGARIVSDHRAADALVWPDKDIDALARHLHAGLRWVQLPDAGIERWLAAGLITDEATFTSARGCYGRQVAEHALALMLGCARRLPECSQLSSWPSARPTGRTLAGAVVALVGAGDIGASLIRMLEPLGAEVVAVTRSGRDVPGATASYAVAELDRVLQLASFVVLAAPSTAQTRQMIAAEELRAMRGDAWLVNVGRGDLVDTDALVEAVRSGGIAGAALDVTDPEPLPDRHPLWSFPQVLITPHVANPPEAKATSLASRVRENTERFIAGRPLLGVVDAEGGY